MTLFRERLLARLLASHAISEELVAKPLAWRHFGFSVHVGEAIAPEEKHRLEDTAACLVRNPLSPKKLAYLDGMKAVLYRSRTHERRRVRDGHRGDRAHPRASRAQQT
jgi:hypothetical protein